MTYSLGEAVVGLRGDTSQLASDVNAAKGQVESALSKIGGSLTSTGKTLTGVVTLPILGMGAVAVNAASDLEEAMNAVNVVFGDSSNVIAAFGQTSAESVGLAQSEFSQMAAQTGALLQNLGLDTRAAADETISLTQRAADMASIFNTDVSQALGAVQSALKGEFDPLEQYGVKLNAAAVNAKALEMGLAETTAELTDQQKAQAALALIYEQTNKIAGDFRNTSDGLANSSRILKAQLADQAAEIGQMLLPTILQLVTTLRDLLTWFTNLSPSAKRMIVVIAGLAAAVGPLLMVLGSLITAFGAVSGAVTAVTGVLAGPVGIILAIIAVLVLLYAAWQNNWFGIRDIGMQVWNAIRSAFQTFMAFLRSIWQRDLGGLRSFFEATWTAIRAIFSAARAALQGDWTAFGQYLRQAWDAIWNFVVNRMQAAWQTLVSIARNIVNGIRAAFQIDWGSIGHSIISGIASGIRSGIASVAEAARSVAKAALDAAKGFLGVHSPSRAFLELGQMSIAGMVRGMEPSPVAAAAQNVASAALQPVAGALGGQAGGSVTNNIEINIHNPTPERASDSISRELMRLSYLGVVG